MPAVHSKATEGQIEYIDEKLVRNGPFDSRSEAVQYLIMYALDVKYGYSE